MSDPCRQEIWIEVDWMPGHRLYYQAIVMVCTVFARHDIAVHIDYGQMGGGTEIPYIPNLDLGNAVAIQLYNN